MNEQRIEITISVIDGEFYPNAKHGESFVCATAQPTIEMALASIATYLRSYAEDALAPGGFASRSATTVVSDDSMAKPSAQEEYRISNGVVYRCFQCRDTFLCIDGEDAICPFCEPELVKLRKRLDNTDPLCNENLDAAYDYLANFGPTKEPDLKSFYDFIESM